VRRWILALALGAAALLPSCAFEEGLCAGPPVTGGTFVQSAPPVELFGLPVDGPVSSSVSGSRVHVMFESDGQPIELTFRVTGEETRSRP